MVFSVRFRFSRISVPVWCERGVVYGEGLGLVASFNFTGTWRVKASLRIWSWVEIMLVFNVMIMFRV